MGPRSRDDCQPLSPGDDLLPKWERDVENANDESAVHNLNGNCEPESVTNEGVCNLKGQWMGQAISLPTRVMRH